MTRLVVIDLDDLDTATAFGRARYEYESGRWFGNVPRWDLVESTYTDYFVEILRRAATPLRAIDHDRSRRVLDRRAVLRARAKLTGRS